MSDEIERESVAVEMEVASDVAVPEPNTMAHERSIILEVESKAPVGAVRSDSTGEDKVVEPSIHIMKPTRDLSVVAPPSRKLRVGDKFVVNFPGGAPLATATIKILTSEPGRHVGVEFEQPVAHAENGNCHGKCRTGHGLWVHPQHLLTEEEHQALIAMGDSNPIPTIPEVEELEFDSETGMIK